MFKPYTPKIEKIAKLFPKVIEELDSIFNENTKIYIDWQNVLHWQEKLGWHFSLKRLKQFFNSFDTIQSVIIYTGTLETDERSLEQIKEIENCKYILSTKPVKMMKISIDVTSIPDYSPAILKNFMKKRFLSKLDIDTVKYLNKKMSLLNKQGITYIEEPKCNFDVEMGVDMLLDCERNNTKSFVLWSGDSDFASPINQIKNSGKRAILFAVSGKVAPELDETGVFIFDVKKIKEFVCFPKEIPLAVKDKLAL
ncbi:MAG TPA: NYN domain-containing protein [Candidatus Paceibacterota bacterium]|nr:NYN domain-containing protein [Candidatus Paceibacterota bacterium]